MDKFIRHFPDTGLQSAILSERPARFNPKRPPTPPEQRFVTIPDETARVRTWLAFAVVFLAVVIDIPLFIDARKMKGPKKFTSIEPKRSAGN